MRFVKSACCVLTILSVASASPAAAAGTDDGQLTQDTMLQCLTYHQLMYELAADASGSMVFFERIMDWTELLSEEVPDPDVRSAKIDAYALELGKAVEAEAGKGEAALVRFLEARATMCSEIEATFAYDYSQSF